MTTPDRGWKWSFEGPFQNIGPWYMLRLRLLPWWLHDLLDWNIFLHLFLKSDRPPIHDHPWPSYSFILWGRMTETRMSDENEIIAHDSEGFSIEGPVLYWHQPELPRWKPYYREAKYRHMIHLKSRWALTVFIPLKKERSWYFYPRVDEEGEYVVQVPWRQWLGMK